MCKFLHLSIKTQFVSQAPIVSDTNIIMYQGNLSHVKLLSVISGLRLFNYTPLIPGVNVMLGRLCKWWREVYFMIWICLGGLPLSIHLLIWLISTIMAF